MELNNVLILFFDINLYLFGNYNLNEIMFKICICGLLFLVDDFVVFELLDKFGCVVKSKIFYEKIWYLVSNKMISVLNGNCFIYIELLFIGKFLFRVNYCGGFRCLIFYYG